MLINDAGNILFSSGKLPGCGGVFEAIAICRYSGANPLMHWGNMAKTANFAPQYDP